MKRDEVTTRRVGINPNARIWILIAVVGIPMLLFTLILHLGALLTTGAPAPGGINPLVVVLQWTTRDRPWSWAHTLVAGGLVALIVGSLLLVLHLLKRRNRYRQRGDDVARHLGRADAFTEEAVRAHAEEAELSRAGVVGLPLAKVVRTGERFWVGFRDGVLEMMGPGSGKTSAQVIPGALDAPGPVWVTSNKPDVAAALYSSRADRGRTWVFDPQQIANMAPEFFYDPLSEIRAGLRERVLPDGSTVTIDGRQARAVELAQQFANSTRRPDDRADAFFDGTGRALLASLLLAGALEEQSLTKVLEWTYRSEDKVPRDLLRKHGKLTAAKQIEGVQGLHGETRDSVYQTASTILAFMLDESARPWVERMGPDDDRPEFNPAAFVRSAGDMMICLSREGVGSFGPVLAAMTNATIRAAEDYAARCPGGRMPVPLVMQLDEVANVCRITELPDLVSHVGSRGILLAPYLQSPAQARMAWGSDGWEKLLGASVVRILGRGLIDVRFLEDMSKAMGEQPVVRHLSSTSRGRGGSSTSHNEHWTMEPIMPVSQLVALPQWRAVAMAAGERAALLELVPWFRRPDLKPRVEQSKADFLALHPEMALAIAQAEAQDVGSAEPAPAAVDVA